jgi:pimeloyl-ACP methyl ester carboxylesterase
MCPFFFVVLLGYTVAASYQSTSSPRLNEAENLILAFSELYFLSVYFYRINRLAVLQFFDYFHLLRHAGQRLELTSSKAARATLIGCLAVTLFTGASVVLAADAAFKTLSDQVYAVEPQDQQLQSLDLYWKASPNKLPVILYIHGGGWVFGDKKEVHQKPAFFTTNNFAFVSMNYRLRWDYTLYDQLEDVVSAIRWIRRHGDSHNLDTQRIILMGHGAGGHLASLIATDPVYLATAELNLKDIRAVVTIDTFSFDIPRVMNELGNFLQRRQHELIFGDTEKTWLAASPISHLEIGQAVPLFALIYPTEIVETTLQNQGFARELVKRGNTAIMIPGSAGATLDADLGKENDPTTLAMLTFLRAAQ